MFTVHGLETRPLRLSLGRHWMRSAKSSARIWSAPASRVGVGFLPPPRLFGTGYRIGALRFGHGEAVRIAANNGVAADRRPTRWFGAILPTKAAAAELFRSAWRVTSGMTALVWESSLSWPTRRPGGGAPEATALPGGARLRAAGSLGSALRRGHALPTAEVGPGFPVAAGPPDPSERNRRVWERGVHAVGYARPNPALHETGRASRLRKARRSGGAPGS
jgi:hypothetical protein